MYESLTARLEEVFKKLRSRGTLTEREVGDALREVRLALLEADVHFKVVKEFLERVRARAVGEEVLGSLTPGQQVIKIVHEELTAQMGGTQSKLALADPPPAVVLLVGLHGSGKTTTAAKLAVRLKREGRHPVLVAADVRRPAARDQLRILAEKVNVAFYEGEEGQDAVAICSGAAGGATQGGWDVVIVDTAGRLHADEELMAELCRISKAVRPHETLLVADAMTGQDAVNVARGFHEAVGLDGVILTKTDGDARGGAALSMRAMVDRPIKFVGVGEKVDALEPFYPERMASRILGMGDVLSLIEKAEQAFSEEQAIALEQKIRREAFTLEDFRDQLGQVRKMGSLDQMLRMVPGLKLPKELHADERELVKLEAIINSMTPGERANAAIVCGSRRRRIARGSGTTVQDVNRLLKQFAVTRKMMRQFAEVGKGKKFRGRRRVV